MGPIGQTQKYENEYWQKKINVHLYSRTIVNLPFKTEKLVSWSSGFVI